MKLYPDKLASHLAKGLEPAYLVAGDEPLVAGEAADEIRQAAQRAGFTEREILLAERGFDWGQLAGSAGSLSLFGDRKILELRLPTGKPGREGSAAIVDFLAGAQANPNPDVLLLVVSGKLDRGAASAKWVKALDAAGVFVQVYPVGVDRLPGWIASRMRQVGLQPDREAVAMLVDRVEGNLLAAKQEIDKLLLLNGPGAVGAEAVTRAVADSARYDVFQLVDGVLEGDAARSLRILEGLRAEGMEPPLIVWGLARELRGLASLAFDISKGRSAEEALSAAHVWPRRRPLISAALRRHSLTAFHRLIERVSRADRMAKGALRGDAWSELSALVTDIAVPGRAGSAA